MAEVTAAELKKLRALESRIVKTRETLSEVRDKRNEFRANATTARRDLRESTRHTAKLEEQIEELISANAEMADELETARNDVTVVSDEASALRIRNNGLTSDLKAAGTLATETKRKLTKAEQSEARLEKQLSNLSQQLKGEKPPELTPEHLSKLLGGFVEKVGSQTGLDVRGTQLNLKVAFSGRGGGAFVIPTADIDPATLPELHELRLDFGRSDAPLTEVESDKPRR